MVRDFRLGTPFDPNTVGAEPAGQHRRDRPAGGAIQRGQRRRLLAGRPLRPVRQRRQERAPVRHRRRPRPAPLHRPHGLGVVRRLFARRQAALSGSADATVRLWDVETGREIKRLTGHEALVTTVAFSPDGRKALSGGYDHNVILWDLEGGRPAARVGRAGALRQSRRLLAGRPPGPGRRREEPAPVGRGDGPGDRPL